MDAVMIGGILVLVYSIYICGMEKGGKIMLDKILSDNRNRYNLYKIRNKIFSTTSQGTVK